MTGLEITTRTEGPVALLTLMGEARVEGIPTLEGAVGRVRGAGARSLLFDMHGLHFLDSASAGTLMRVAQELEQTNGTVVLFGLQRLIARMIETTGLTACFQVAPDEAAARQLLVS